MSVRSLSLSALLVGVLVAGLAFAEAPPSKPDEAQPVPPAAPAPRKFVSEHRLAARDGDLAYTATAEEIQLKDGDGRPIASFFTISYVEKGVARPEERPVTFVFNGGPGSASVWLHFGLVGPKRIDIPSDATDPGGAPYRLRDNPWTILRATDLVFIDPVGTGYSKALGAKKNADFWGYDEDADAIAELIRTFITVENRWNSPKFLLGESYGGVRAALLVPRLQQQLNIGLNGVILISPALNLGTLPFDVAGNDLPYVTHLPAFAAVANYHRKLPDSWPNQEALLAEVESWAGSEYLAALFQGDRLPQDERERIAERLHRYTGLSRQYILRADLRIDAMRFLKELLREEGKAIGLLDGRYVQDERDDVATLPDGDPFDAKTGPIYIASFQTYLRNALGVDLVERYVPSNSEANRVWRRPHGQSEAFSGYVDVTGQLAQGTKDSDHLRIFSAAGCHDLTTSYFATEYMLRHSGIDADRLTLRTYPGGHMMYLHQPSLERLSEDIVAFVAKR